MPFSVAKQLLVTGPHGQWLPEEQKELSGRDFVKFKKWSSGLVKFMTGQSLCFDRKRAAGSVDRPIWQEILLARQQKADAMVQEALKTATDSEEDPEPRPSGKKAPKPVKAAAKHAHLVDGILEVTVRGQQFAVLYEGIGLADFWMEASAANFEFLQSELLKDAPKDRKAKKKAKAKAAAKAASDCAESQPSEEE